MAKENRIFVRFAVSRNARFYTYKLGKSLAEKEEERERERRKERKRKIRTGDCERQQLNNVEEKRLRPLRRTYRN